jgi:heme exporter protein B
VNALTALILRDARAAFTGGAWLPLAFFMLVAILFPFGVGPDGPLLARTGGGVIWVAALLAALLPVDRLIAPDAENGTLDQLAVRGISEELIVAAKFIAHWISFGPLLMIAAIPAAALLRLSGETLWRIEIGLLIGTPGLAALGMMAASMTLGLRRAGALAGLLMLPLAVPLLIFGAGTLAPNAGSAMLLLGASSLFLCAIMPFAAGGAIRASRE